MYFSKMKLTAVFLQVNLQITVLNNLRFDNRMSENNNKCILQFPRACSHAHECSFYIRDQVIINIFDP